MEHDCVQVFEENGGLEFFDSLSDAYEYALFNENVWKISYSKGDKIYCWIKYLRSENEATLLCMSPTYRNCKDEKMVFWVNEPMELLINERIRSKKEKNDSTKIRAGRRICLSSDEFRKYIKNNDI